MRLTVTTLASTCLLLTGLAAPGWAQTQQQPGATQVAASEPPIRTAPVLAIPVTGLVPVQTSTGADVAVPTLILPPVTVPAWTPGEARPLPPGEGRLSVGGSGFSNAKPKDDNWVIGPPVVYGGDVRLGLTVGF